MSAEATRTLESHPLRAFIERLPPNALASGGSWMSLSDTALGCEPAGRTPLAANPVRALQLAFAAADQAERYLIPALEVRVKFHRGQLKDQGHLSKKGVEVKAKSLAHSDVIGGYTFGTVGLAVKAAYESLVAPDLSIDGGAELLGFAEDGVTAQLALIGRSFVTPRDSPYAGHPDATLVGDEREFVRYLVRSAAQEHVQALLTAAKERWNGFPIKEKEVVGSTVRIPYVFFRGATALGEKLLKKGKHTYGEPVPEVAELNRKLTVVAEELNRLNGLNDNRVVVAVQPATDPQGLELLVPYRAEAGGCCGAFQRRSNRRHCLDCGIPKPLARAELFARDADYPLQLAGSPWIPQAPSGKAPARPR